MDLRNWIESVRSLGQLKEVRGADVQSEIGGITDIFMDRPGRPALLFDEIPGYQPGFQVLSNVATSKERVALTLFGESKPMGDMELVRALLDLSNSLTPLPPRVVKEGPVLENVVTGDDVDLTIFPSPIWHELDKEPFIGTGSAVIIGDPESDWINVGCYRVAVHGPQKAGLMISAGHNGHTLMSRWWDLGKPCPVAISCGHHPLLFMVGGLYAPAGVCEFDLAGGILGEPLPVIEGPYTGLPVPAHSEIVIEGEAVPGELQDEGPFGEWSGYYAGGRRPAPVIRVKNIMYRNNPIILGVIPRKPPSDNTFYCTYFNSAEVWKQMEGAGIRGIQGVWMHPASGSRLLTVVSIRQQYPGHAKQAGMIAAHTITGAYANRYVIVVDDDIDPTNTEEVIWALSTRVEAREDVEFVRRSWSTALDPMAYAGVDGKPVYNTKMVIDACIPWDRRNTFPAVSRASKELRRQLWQRWQGLFEEIGETE